MGTLLDRLREIAHQAPAPTVSSSSFFLRFAPVILGWLLIHAYLGVRLIRPAGFHGVRRAAAWTALVAATLLPPFAMFAERTQLGVASIERALDWSAFTSMGLSSLVTLLVVARDVALVGSRTARRALSRGRPVAPDPRRRAFLTNGVNMGILLGAGSATGVGAATAQVTPEVVRVDIPIPGLAPDAEGFTIAQITDLHAGLTIGRDFVDRVVDATNGLGADVIAVTGDVADGYPKDVVESVAPLARLSAPDGVFFVTGNHEYYWSTQAWIDVLGAMGLTLLGNEHRVLQRGRAQIVLAGVYDYRAGSYMAAHRSDPVKAVAGAPAGATKILLAHQPRSVFDAARAGFDLQISGHTHGGQYFPLSLIVPFFEPYVRGLHRHDGRMWIYVSRGTGYWGPPQRLGVGTEITLLRLVRG